MEIFSLVLLVLYLVSTLPVHVVAENAVDASTASTLIKEGQSAEILCMTKGPGDYFWRKGESLLNSSLVASFTGGQVRKDAEPYVVTENGTLIIKIVTLGDEGKYFCRVSSVINECYGELNVFVEASLRSFVLAIDRCDRESSCLLYISPTQSTSLTCTATDASPSMTLKWFNGSTEITEGIEKYDLPTQNGNAREIRSTITTVYGHPASLTCQAVDPKRGNNDVRFAHAQVETTVPVTATLQSWIIVAITLAGCLIVFGIYKLIKAMANRTQNKKYKKLKTERHQSLQVSAGFKDSELSELKGKLSQTEEELKESRKENFDSLKGIASNEAKITLAEEIAKAKDQEIKTKDEELTKLKSRVPSHLQEISSLKGDVQSKEKALADLESKLMQTEAEVKKGYNEIIELQKRIANNEAKMTAAEELAKTKDQEIKNKDQELTDLTSKVPDQIQEMSTLKQDVRSKAKAIADLESKLMQTEAEVKKGYNEIIELQKINSNAFANEKSRNAVAKELMKTKANEITELKETVKQRDKEIKNQRENLLYCQTNLQRKEIDIQSKSGDISKLQSNLKEKQNEIEDLQKELAKLKGDVQSKPKRIADLETKLRKRDEGIKEANNKIVKLQGDLLEKERELILAMQPKGAQKGSQKKSGKKH